MESEIMIIFWIEVLLLYNVSGVQQSDSYIYIYIYIYTHTHTHKYIYTHKHICIYTYTNIYVGCTGSSSLDMGFL